MKKKIATTVALMLCLSACAAGCGKKDYSSDTTATVTSQNTSEDASADTTTIKGSSEIIYNKTTIKLGDNLNSLIDKLGSQAAPSAQVVSCISAATISQYYYPGMTIEVTDDGIIYSIEIRDNGYPGDFPTTSANISLGSDVSLIIDTLGTDNCKIYQDKQYCYTDGTYNVQYDLKDGVVKSIWIYDTSYIN